MPDSEFTYFWIKVADFGGRAARVPAIFGPSLRPIFFVDLFGATTTS
jgi:hypothetical protein